MRCNRVHYYPDKSTTLLIKNMYSGPGLAWDQDDGLEKIAEIAHANDALVLVDNSIVSLVLSQPLELGAG
ncbi:hypothetical protein L2E82_10491 [Cichorium intybus]|uniref:Uncharacterized protein n=1 Tax=Cichorium intybus TaxID=13427 RepID=A0ACB9GAR8_CICIN|nr:hypothetical protein L2E82_10491 [Cichorium intybus]